MMSWGQKCRKSLEDTKQKECSGTQEDQPGRVWVRNTIRRTQLKRNQDTCFFLRQGGSRASSEGGKGKATVDAALGDDIAIIESRVFGGVGRSGGKRFKRARKAVPTDNKRQCGE